MYNYYPNVVWIIDAILLAASLALAVLIIFNILIREHLWRRRSKALLNIKQHVYEMMLTGKPPETGEFAQTLLTTLPQQFLDVTTNRSRELIFFNEAEQEIFKKVFLSPRNIARLKRLARMPGSKWRRIEAIMSLGYAGIADSANILKKSLFSMDEDISYFSMIAIGQIKNIESAKALIEFFKKRTVWRYKIISILESFPPAIGDEAIKLVRDKDASGRLWALRLISKFDVSNYIDKLKPLVQDESADVRAALCDCLGRSGLKTAEGILTKALNDSSWLVRASAAKGLSELLKHACVPSIIKLVSDGSLSVVNAVKEILVSHIEEAIPYLEKFLEGADAIAKRTAIEVLEKSGYIIKIFEQLLYAKGERRGHAARLLNGMIISGAHLGLEGALEAFNAESRAKIIEMVKEINADFADHLERKMKGEILE